MKDWIIKNIPFFFIIISVCSITQWITLPMNYEVVWFIVYLMLIVGLWFSTGPKNLMIQNVWLVFIVLEAIYGAVFMAENYFDYKALVYNSLIFLLAIGAYSFRNPFLISSILGKWLKFVWPIYIILLPFLLSDAHGRYLFPFCFFILFYQCLDKKLRIYVIIAFLLNLFLGQENRSDLIRFSIAFLLSFSYFKFSWIRKHSKSIVRFLYALPVVLLFLALMANFNIFKYAAEYSDISNYTFIDENGYKRNMLEDTRSLLYEEQILTSIKYKSYLFGRSPARGYDSEKFGEWVDMMTRVKRGERGGCEVYILNLFNYTGIVGVVLYTLIFMTSTYYAVWKSKNSYIPIVGIYITFRWVYSWVEEFTAFNLSAILLWMMVGMCMSQTFREMNDTDFVNWIRSIGHGNKKTTSG